MKPEEVSGASVDSLDGAAGGTVGADDGSGALEHAPIKRSEQAPMTTPALRAGRDLINEYMSVIVGQHWQGVNSARLNTGQRVIRRNATDIDVEAPALHGVRQRQNVFLRWCPRRSSSRRVT